MCPRVWFLALALGLLIPGPGFPVSVPSASRKIEELAKARLEAARVVLKDVLESYSRGRGTVDEEQVVRWSRRVLKLERAIGDKKAQLTALEAHLARMKKLEKMARDRVAAGLAARSQFVAATYHRLEAEIWLARAKAK